MHVKPNHPLLELLARLLFSIEIVPAKEQRRMVNRACREAVKWHNIRIETMKLWIKDMERDAVADNSTCPQCDRRLGNWTGPYHPGVHKKDCDLAILIDAKRGR